MIDANVFFSACVWPRSSYHIIRHALNNDIRLVLSKYVIEQTRRNIRDKFPRHLNRFEIYLELLDYDLVEDPTREDVYNNISLVRDITDVPIALSAINNNVNCLVSEDNDFLIDDETTRELRQHIIIKNSKDFLRDFMNWTTPGLQKIRNKNWRDG
jgi:putative PIN family toxin of toxin-antitoxin system